MASGGARRRSGPPPKPIEQKRALGNPGKRALPGGAALAVVAPVERTMADQSPLSAFDLVLHRGVSWLAETDAPSLALLRSLLEEREPLREQAFAGSSEARKSLRDLDKQITPLLSQLGFDPAARSRLGLAEVKAASKLEGIRASQDRRMAPQVANQDNAG